jgi:hypothetical protein
MVRLGVIAAGTSGGIRWVCTWERTDGKGLDTDHVPFAAKRAVAQGLAGQSFVAIAVIFLVAGLRGQGCRGVQKLSAEREFGVPVTVGEESVMADVLQPMGICPIPDLTVGSGVYIGLN